MTDDRKRRRAQLLEDALAYGQAGFKIHPCRYDAKTGRKPPLLDDWQQRATSDPATIAEMWKAHPDALIGLLTGASNNVDVIDVDKKKGKDGHEALPKWAGMSNIISATPNDGHQLFYRHDPDLELKNSAGKLAPGIDIRTTGGYVILPPSYLPDGRCYEWHDGDLRDADLCRAVVSLPLGRLTRPETKAPRASVDTPISASIDRERLAVEFLQEQFDKLSKMVAGEQRNSALNDAAYQLGALVREKIIDRDTVEERLLVACQHNGKLDEDGERQCRATIRSGLDGGIAKATLPARFQVQVAHPLTEHGNAQRIIDHFGQNMIFCREWKSWLVWDGSHWVRNRNKRARQLAAKTLLALKDEELKLFKAGQQDLSKHVGRWALLSQSRRVIDNSLNLAEDQRLVEAEQLDADDWLLNLKNGTLDLKAGKLREHRREDMLTRVSKIAFDADARCPTWDAFIAETYGGDSDLIKFVQRAVGYSLTGDISERALFLLYGDSASGKTTILETLLKLLGDHAAATEFTTLLHQDQRGVRNDIAALAGKRLVTSSEVNEGQRFDEAVIKQLTGKDTIRARFLYQEGFDFKATFKIWAGVNYLPLIRGHDEAIWNRVKVIPHDHCKPPEERDLKLQDKLVAELSGILNWALVGCREWQEIGLLTPAKVALATTAYREEQDTIGRFINDCIVVTGNQERDYIAVVDFYAQYSQFCEELGVGPKTKDAISKVLVQKLKWENKKRRFGQITTRCWLGVRRYDPNEHDPRGDDVVTELFPRDALNPRS